MSLDGKLPSQNDELIQKFLKKAGLDENAPIDPSSRVALQELLTQKMAQESTTVDNNLAEFTPMPAPGSLQANPGAAAANQKKSSPPVEPFQQPPPVSQVNKPTSSFMQRHVSDLSSAGWRMEDSNASTAGDDTMSKEDRILQLLERQSDMIVELHRRMDQLTAAVVAVGSGGGGGGGEQQQYGQAVPLPRQLTRQNLNRRIDELTMLVDQYKRGVNESRISAVPLGASRADEPFVDAEGEWMRQQQRQGQQQPQQQQPMVFPPSPLTRLARMIQLFFALRRHHAPNFDLGLIIKVLVMLVILLSRLQTRRQHADEDDWMWEYRFYFMVIFVVGGFALQSGIVSYLYTFFVKENYPARIWAGEEVATIEQQVAQQQRPAPAVRDAQGGGGGAAGGGGWRHTFLAGVIARNDDEQQGGFGILRFVADIGFFVGSFFLSIFPMWRPEALAEPRPVLEEEEQAEDADDGTGLPDVRPPQDPVEAEEEEEGENNE